VIEGPGRVRRLTAAIVVNDRMMQPASHGKGAQWQPRTPDEIRNLTALAQAAVGFDTSRGDVVTVQDLAFDDNRLQQSVPWWKQLLEQAQSSPVIVKYTALLLGLMLVLFFGLRPALGRARNEVKQVKVAAGKGAAGKDVKELLAAAQAPPVLKPPEPAEADPERVRNQEILQQVTDHLKKEPTQSSRLLQSWIHTE
jgi:flagellar M-ring protein FliF